MFCRNCGAQADGEAQFCIRCGASLKESDPAVPPPPVADHPPPPPPLPAGSDRWTAAPPHAAVPAGYEPKQKLVAALLGIFLGVFGIHRFYLGYNGIGAAQLALGLGGVFTCGVTSMASAIWGIIDGVLILTGSIRTDAKGVPLRD
jgi:TM2 domain-containing membrane protein YozV